jgi:hypothetical protein
MEITSTNKYEERIISKGFFNGNDYIHPPTSHAGMDLGYHGRAYLEYEVNMKSHNSTEQGR